MQRTLDQGRQPERIIIFRDCGISVSQENHSENLMKKVGKYPFSYVFTENSLWFVNQADNTCTHILVDAELLETLKVSLGVKNQLGQLKAGEVKQHHEPLSTRQLQIISYNTKHELPPKTLYNVLADIGRNQKEQWQTYITGTLTDEELYYFLLDVDVNRIIDGGANLPAEHDVSKDIREAARLNLDKLLERDLIIPAKIRDEVVSKMKLSLFAREDVSSLATADRVYLFCLLEAYHRIRGVGPEFVSKKSEWGALFFSGLSKTEKLGACELYKEFILSDYKLNEFDKFLKKKNRFKDKSTLLQGFIGAIHKCASKWGAELEARVESASLEAPSFSNSRGGRLG